MLEFTAINCKYLLGLLQYIDPIRGACIKTQYKAEVLATTGGQSRTLDI